MLHARTSSAINLRMESGRRHAIRNLKAKVRSLLPADTCARQRKRKHKSQKLELANNTKQEWFQHRHYLSSDKKRNKIFEKLTRKEIQQINENKHYFLDNEQSIAFYEGYVKENYPEIVEHEWAAPQPEKQESFPFAFIPSNLINPSEFASKKLASEKRLLQKRNSGSKSLGILRKPSIPVPQSPLPFTESRVSKNKAVACITRKQARQEEEKIKRQINSVHLQRSQHEAQAKKQKMLQDRSDIAKMTLTSAHFGKYDQRRWGGEKWMEYDINALTSQLRRVCLHRRKESIGEQPTP